MTDITNLTENVINFVVSHKDTAPPVLLDQDLQDTPPVITAFQHTPHTLINLKKLAKYCAFYKNYPLAIQLLDLATELYPHQHEYHYFQAILYFKQNNIPATMLAIEKMLQIMQTSETQKKHILNRLQDENFKKHCIFFIDNLLKEFNLPLTQREFNIFILPYDLTNKDQMIQYYYSVYFVMFCNTLKWVDNGQLTTLLAIEYDVNGSSPWYHLCMGRLAWILHDRKQADFHFKQAKKLSIKQNIIFTTGDCGVYTWLSDEEIQNLPQLQKDQDPFQLKMWQWFYADLKENHPDISIILGCDFKYFRYFPKFLFSLIKAHIQNNYQEKTVISICLDNPSPEQIKFLRKTAEYIHLHIPYFYLTFGYGLCPYQDGAYFASVRYLFAPELFTLYPTQTFIVDIDAFAYSDFYSRLKNIKNKYDFGLRIYAFDHYGNQISGEPWCLGAGILYLGDLEKTKAILQFLKQYVNYAYDPKNPLNWCIDQCALVQAFDYYIKPFWNTLSVTDIDHNPPFLLSHIIGEKDDFYNHEGVIDLDNFHEVLQQLIH
ncbi:tetratricopeptide repeat protein [Commensalibacter nepenthis]|uniref:Tetratricopeptide repeat protein n=1 Tax=Commensalibacter nepenthis TaxID=3043872 RepID=A0ABT6Q6W2_9PROT|nr:hypothetical protein [Commensalibacter sp. TBRC 10068]MDI2112633.1 hypothetical protein [Commensalibacter sp. TBRC 10068]